MGPNSASWLTPKTKKDGCLDPHALMPHLLVLALKPNWIAVLSDFEVFRCSPSSEHCRIIGSRLLNGPAYRLNLHLYGLHLRF